MPGAALGEALDQITACCNFERIPSPFVFLHKGAPPAGGSSERCLQGLLAHDWLLLERLLLLEALPRGPCP